MCDIHTMFRTPYTIAIRKQTADDCKILLIKQSLFYCDPDNRSENLYDFIIFSCFFVFFVFL